MSDTRDDESPLGDATDVSNGEIPIDDVADRRSKKKLPVLQFQEEDVDPDKQTFGQKGIVCKGCELEGEPRVFGRTAATRVDVLLVSEAPSALSANNTQMFHGQGGRVIKRAWQRIIELDNATGHKLKAAQMSRLDAYAVQCYNNDETPNVKTVARCAHYLVHAIQRKRPRVIVTFGATALRALGHRFHQRFDDIRGKVIHVQILGEDYIVVPTFSAKAVVAKTGLYNLLLADLLKGVRIASGQDELLAQTPIEELSKEYVLPKTAAEVEALCEMIAAYAGPNRPPANWTITFDIETNTLHTWRSDAQILCISFAWDDRKACAIPIDHPQRPWTGEDRARVIGAVRRLFACAKPKVPHGGQFDLKLLERVYGFVVENYAWDTLYGEHLLREDLQGAYSLKALGRTYFPQYSNYADKVQELAEAAGAEEADIDDELKGLRKGAKLKTMGLEEVDTCEVSKAEIRDYLHPEAKKKSRGRKARLDDIGFSSIPIDLLLQYAAVDTDLTRQLCKQQIQRLQQENYQHGRTLMRELTLPAVRVLGGMEHRGMRIDRPYLANLRVQLKAAIERTRSEIMTQWPSYKTEPFNPNTVKQVAELLYSIGVMDPQTGQRAIRGNEQLVGRNEKSGMLKTDKKALRAIVEKFKCPFAKSLLEYRAAEKADGGFLSEIEYLSSVDGYLHTSFHLTGTATYRLSSSNINMQNIPKKLAGCNIKKLFIPDNPEEEVIVDLDYKGAEIRIFTAYAKDEKLIKALNEGLDVHCYFVSTIYKIPYEETILALEEIEKTDPRFARFEELNQLRTNIKRVVFGILYGAGPRKIAETAGIDEAEARNIIQFLFDLFPSIPTYVKETHSAVSRLGFVETIIGHRRRFPLVPAGSRFRSQAERRAVNMKIQSTSSDIVLGQLVELNDHVAEIGGRLCLTVHDSIVMTAKRKYAEQLESFLKYYCVERVAQKYPWLPVEFSCDIKVGPSYGETKKLQEFLNDEKKRGIVPNTDVSFSDAPDDISFDDEIFAELREEEEAKDHTATIVAIA